VTGVRIRRGTRPAAGPDDSARGLSSPPPDAERERVQPFSELTLWPRMAGPLRSFLRAETGGAAAMLGATVAALVWANSPWPHSYESFWTTAMSIRIGHNGISQDLRHWVNDALMVLFFLVVGLEARRELEVGQLRERWTVHIPLVAAIGGMTVPIAIYLAFNAGGPAARGWGAAMSTDSAFLLGVLALVAPGGTRLRVRLLTLSLFDDLIALVVIAIVYTSRVSAFPLLLAIGLFAVLAAVRYAPEASRAVLASAIGVAIWVALYESGIDPVVSGLAIGLVTSAYLPHRERLGRAVDHIRLFREQPTPELARTAQRSVASAISPNERLEHLLHPWTSYLIVPTFALANAGIQLNGPFLIHAVGSPITLGIFLGYVLGKPIGITASATLGLRFGVGRRALSTPAIVGGGIVAGIGFTVSLLISSLVFHGLALREAKLGILATPIVASVTGLIAFRLIARLPTPMRMRQLARTVEDIVDLSDDVDPERDHIRGGADAPVTLVEYGDYECQYCGQAESVVRELLLSFGDDLRYVWRHLPLTDVHPHAQMAAEAAEAAAAQGAFWGMHDELLAHQEELATRDLARRAEGLGLDTSRFSTELLSRKYAERVAEDVATADASGVTGTPSFFIDGKRHHGAYDIASLTSAVRAAQSRAAARSVRLGETRG
jgi:Na+/H+ antiporter NhaA